MSVPSSEWGEPHTDAKLLMEEAQIQGAYMLACQELYREWIARNILNETKNIPGAIPMSSIDLSQSRFLKVKSLVQDQRGRIFACMWGFFVWWDVSLLSRSQERYDQWLDPDAVLTSKILEVAQASVKSGNIVQRFTWTILWRIRWTHDDADWVLKMSIVNAEIQKRIHVAHMLFRGNMIRKKMSYDEAVGISANTLGDMIEEIRSSLVASGVQLPSFEKLAWDTVACLIARVNVDIYLLTMESELTTFQALLDTNHSMGSFNPTFPQI